MEPLFILLGVIVLIAVLVSVQRWRLSGRPDPGPATSSDSGSRARATRRTTVPEATTPAPSASHRTGSTPTPLTWPTREAIVRILASEPDQLAPEIGPIAIESGLGGLIQPMGGANAFSIKVTRAVNEPWLLRFFNNRPTPAMASRYRRLGQLDGAQRRALGLPELLWLDPVLVGTDVPAVAMRRVPGVHLDEFIADHFDDRVLMSVVAARLRDRLLSFHSVQFAHGDLQDGNLMVVGDDRDLALWLVDLDDCYLPGVHDGVRSIGHSNYQHPKRSSDDWGPYVDGFSGLLLWVGLRAIAEDPELWARFEDEGSVLFQARDLKAPGETELWRELAKSPDRQVREATDALAELCRADRPPAVPFGDLLPSW